MKLSLTSRWGAHGADLQAGILGLTKVLAGISTGPLSIKGWYPMSKSGKRSKNPLWEGVPDERGVEAFLSSGREPSYEGLPFLGFTAAAWGSSSVASIGLDLRFGSEDGGDGGIPNAFNLAIEDRGPIEATYVDLIRTISDAFRPDHVNLAEARFLDVLFEEGENVSPPAGGWMTYVRTQTVPSDLEGADVHDLQEGALFVNRSGPGTESHVSNGKSIGRCVRSLVAEARPGVSRGPG